jgi:hypothetical protein
MLQTLVKKWFEQIGIQEMSDNDILNVIRKFKLDKLPPQHLMLMKMVSPILFMCITKLNEETIDWGNMDEIPGFEEISDKDLYQAN